VISDDFEVCYQMFNQGTILFQDWDEIGSFPKNHTNLGMD
jgi:hypothetical protein